MKNEENVKEEGTFKIKKKPSMKKLHKKDEVIKLDLSKTKKDEPIKVDLSKEKENAVSGETTTSVQDKGETSKESGKDSKVEMSHKEEPKQEETGKLNQ